MNHSVEHTKHIKNFIFALQQREPCHPSTIIHEGDKPTHARDNGNGRRSLNIRVNQGKRSITFIQANKKRYTMTLGKDA
jgi:hypothetical protein